ncbi:MAG: C1 family peptidase [Clostridia bacterium]|nr:C1 family peptidase [Clostridia bacterium]MBR2388201.1 C1 family peptidase [Clostridia bacterium]
MLNNDVVKSQYDVRDYSISAESDFPEAFCVDVKVPVKNQGYQGTCVAHALSSVIEYHYKRQHNTYEKFSTEFIYGYRPEGYYVGSGMRIRDALKTIQQYGDVFVSDCHGNNDCEKAMQNVSANLDTLKELAYPHRISAYFKINSADELKTALMKHGVVVVSMNTYKGSKLVDDVYTYDSTAEHGRHCVFIYGWNEKGWLVQNSWGILYGGDGRFIIPFDYKFNEMWGIVDNITEGELNKPKRNSFLDIIYSVWNMIVNLYYYFTNKS